MPRWATAAAASPTGGHHGTMTSPPVPLPRQIAHAPTPPRRRRRRRDGRREGTFPARRRSRVLPHGRGAGGRERAGGLWRERASHQPLHLLLPRLRRHVQQGLAAGRAPLPAHGPGEPGWPLLGRGSSGAGFPLGPRREVCGTEVRGAVPGWRPEPAPRGAGAARCSSWGTQNAEALAGPCLKSRRRGSCCGRPPGSAELPRGGLVCEHPSLCQRPYVCGYDGCGKSFIREFHRARHLLTHTGEKPVK